VNGDDDTVAQVTKQLDKLIEVIHVSNISNEEIVVRELALIKVSSTATNRGEIIQIVNLFRANIVDVGTQSMVIEITGEEDKIQALYSLLEPFGILEMLRTGRVAMVRGQSDGRVSDSIGFDVYGSRSSTGNGNGHGEVRVV
jgi:acetolactate synthase-1/3 small subunit